MARTLSAWPSPAASVATMKIALRVMAPTTACGWTLWLGMGSSDRFSDGLLSVHFMPAASGAGQAGSRISQRAAGLDDRARRAAGGLDDAPRSEKRAVGEGGV